MPRAWTWTISDIDGSNRRTMTLGQYIAEAKQTKATRGSTMSVHPQETPHPPKKPRPDADER